MEEERARREEKDRRDRETAVRLEVSFTDPDTFHFGLPDTDSGSKKSDKIRENLPKKN